MTPEQAQMRAISSILDVVEEIALKVGDPDWAEIVTQTFNEHRAELREADPSDH